MADVQEPGKVLGRVGTATCWWRSHNQSGRVCAPDLAWLRVSTGTAHRFATCPRV
jgi:hypothetical protein